MHARMSRAQAQPGKLDEAVTIVRDSVVPAARRQQGFKGGFALTDRSTNKILTISLWETEADTSASETSYFPETLSKLASVFDGPPTVERYEVSA